MRHGVTTAILETPLTRALPILLLSGCGGSGHSTTPGNPNSPGSPSSPGTAVSFYMGGFSVPK